MSASSRSSSSSRPSSSSASISISSSDNVSISSSADSSKVSVSLANEARSSTRSVGKKGFCNTEVNSSADSASLDFIYKDLSNSILLFNSCIASSLYKVSSTTSKSYLVPSMASTLSTTSSSSEVFCALNVTNLFTTGLLFKSNIFITDCLCWKLFLHYCIKKN